MLKLVLIAALAASFVVVGCSASYGPSAGCSGSTACANGAGTMTLCYTLDSSGACATAYYQVGSVIYDCVSCDDQGYCSNAALIACGVPDASIPADADFPPDAAPVPVPDSGHATDASAHD